MLAQVAPTWKALSDASIQVGAAVCGLVGVIALGIYFGAAPPLPPLDAGATQVADIGIRDHGILFSSAPGCRRPAPCCAWCSLPPWCTWPVA